MNTKWNLGAPKKPLQTNLYVELKASNWGRFTGTPVPQTRRSIRIFLRNPRIFAEIPLTEASLPERNDWHKISQVHNVLKMMWEWSSWSLLREQGGTNVSFISNIHVRSLLWNCVFLVCFVDVATDVLGCFVQGPYSFKCGSTTRTKNVRWRKPHAGCRTSRNKMIPHLSNVLTALLISCNFSMFPLSSFSKILFSFDWLGDKPSAPNSEQTDSTGRRLESLTSPAADDTSE